MGIFRKKKKKPTIEEKIAKKLDSMSDEEILELEKKLYLKSGAMVLVGVLVVIGCILLLLIVPPLLYK